MPIIAPPAPRLVSLVPSQTELLFALGLDASLVGRTKFCTHPADKVAAVPVVGGTKNVHLDRVAALHPTLILANREENTEADVRALESMAPVHVTDVNTLPDALAMIREVGGLVGRIPEAETLARQISASMGALPPMPPARRPSVAYLIWRDPWMVAARNTFIDAMLTEAGFRNAFADPPNPRWVRYPVVEAADLQQVNPDVLLLSSEPYPFTEKPIPELRACCPAATIRLVDGELFSWYGSRLLLSAPYFAQLRADLIPAG